MRALRFALLALSRDWRSGELAVLLAALLVAVTALTGVGFFTDRIGQAVDQRAAEVLAADLRLRSSGTDLDRVRGARRRIAASPPPASSRSRASCSSARNPRSPRCGR